MEKVTMVLADEDVERRIELKKMLFQNPDIDVVGETEEINETIDAVTEEAPEMLFLSFPMGDEDDTSDLVEELAVESPQTEIILIADSMEESESARKLQRLGVRDLLVRPLDTEELLEVVEDVVSVARRQKEKLTEMMTGKTVSRDQRSGKIISVFSTKGGVGRSLLATNLACTIKDLTEKTVAVVDLDLQFGDDAIMLDMTPTTTIGSLARDCEDEQQIDLELLDRYMHTHQESGIELLAAPPRPEEADYVGPEQTQKILDALKRNYHYVVVDTSSQVTEPVIASLENSDLIVLLLTLELPTIKDGKLMLELIDDLGLSRDKVQIIMNRDMPGSEIELQEVEEALDQEVLGGIPSDGNFVMPSVNEGRPIMLSHPNSDFSAKLKELTHNMLEDSLELGDEILVEETETSTPGEIDLSLAPIGERLIAGLIDHSIAYLVGWGIFIGLGVFLSIAMDGSTGTLIGMVVGGFGLLVPLGYYTFMHTGPQPIGKQIMNLKVTDQSGSSLGFGASFLRSLGGLISFIFAGLGYIPALLSTNRQGMHDLIAGSYVVTESETSSRQESDQTVESTVQDDVSSSDGESETEVVDESRSTNDARSEREESMDATEDSSEPGSSEERSEPEGTVDSDDETVEAREDEPSESRQNDIEESYTSSDDANATGSDVDVQAGDDEDDDETIEDTSSDQMEEDDENSEESVSGSPTINQGSTSDETAEDESETVSQDEQDQDDFQDSKETSSEHSEDDEEASQESTEEDLDSSEDQTEEQSMNESRSQFTVGGQSDDNQSQESDDGTSSSADAGSAAPADSVNDDESVASNEEAIEEDVSEEQTNTEATDEDPTKTEGLEDHDEESGND